MAVDAAIDHEPGRDDRGVTPGLGEQLRVQRDLERTRHLEQIDMRARDVARLDLVQECDAAFLDNLAMPGGLHERDPLRLGKARMRGNGWTLDGFESLFWSAGCLGRVFYFGSILQHLIHGFPLSGPE